MGKQWRMLAVAAIAGILQPVWARTNPDGLKFLEDNKKRAGVVELRSGLQYKVLQLGEGMEQPLIGSFCVFHFEGRTLRHWPDGKAYDSSYARNDPATFILDKTQVIEAWVEALQLMVVGDKWEVYVPSELAYGDAGQGRVIRPGEVLVFILELVKIKVVSVPIGNTVEKSPESVKVPTRPANRCRVTSTNLCLDREKDYMNKQLDKTDWQIKEELKRLEDLENSRMKPDRKNWLTRRVNMLRNLLQDPHRRENVEL